MALNRVWIPSPNYSNRAGTTVRIIVLHTAEGARTYRDLGAYFQTPGLQASSHVGIDDTANTIGEYVHRSDKAWTVAAFNGVSVNVELCAFADWSTDTWKNDHHTMLENCARWIAEEAAYYKIPITALTAAEAQGGMRGVCQHRDLGAAGGGHHDCGPGFPMDYVLQMARGGTPKPPTPLPITKEDMITAVVKKNGAIEVFVEKNDGRIFHNWQAAENGKWQEKWSPMGNPGK